MEVTIGNSRKQVLQAEFDKPYFADIKSKLVDEMKQGPIYPPASLVFNAFNTTPFDKVKVVII
jgi:uracil-DNA glycosylase